MEMLKINKRTVFFLKLSFFVFLSIIFLFLIEKNIFKYVTQNIQFAVLMAYIVLILFFKDMTVQINVDFNKNIIFKIVQAIIIPLLMLVVMYFIVKLSMNTNRTPNIKWLSITLICSELIGALFEEIGWRSFLKTKLEKHFSVLLSAIIVGIAWGLWHIPMYYRKGIPITIIFIFITIMASIIMAVILKNTKNNIFISTLFHTSFNISSGVFLMPLGLTVETYSIMLLVLTITALIVVLINRKYLLIKIKVNE